MDLQALLLREPEMESLLPRQTQTFLVPCLHSHSAQISLEGHLELLTSIPFQPKVWEISFGLGWALLRQRSRTYHSVCERSEERKAGTSEAP